jgi:hypothetical protein
LIVARGEYSVEAWVIPDNTSQTGDDTSAVIASYSSGTSNRNFTLGQDEYKYVAHNRVTETSGSALATPNGDTVVQTSLQHVVMTYSETAGRKIYINGVPKVCETAITASSGEFPTTCEAAGQTSVSGPLSQWDPGYLLTVGSDTNGSNQWMGIVKFLAIHRAALTEREIKINYDAGVGQKFNLLFNISDFRDQASSNGQQIGSRSYIWFEVAEYDDYSYLFSEPKFIDLGYNAQPVDTRPTVNFSLRGMRIGVNGKEAVVGQAFDRLGKSTDPTETDTVLQISSADPVSLTRLQGEQFGIRPASGTIVPKDIGVSTDQFFLTFEKIGGINDTKTRAGQVYTFDPVYNTDPNAQPFIVGLRTFDEINATMSALTGVSQGSVADEYASIKGQLPAEESAETFSSSQQTAIAGLAGLYCDKRVDDQGIVDGLTRAQYFGVDESVFTGSPSGLSGSVPTIAQAIVNRMVRNVSTLDFTSIQPELESLATYLLGGTGHACNPNPQQGVTQECTTLVRTQAIVKAMCTAMLSSAVVTHQ